MANKDKRQKEVKKPKQAKLDLSNSGFFVPFCIISLIYATHLSLLGLILDTFIFLNLYLNYHG